MAIFIPRNNPLIVQPDAGARLKENLDVRFRSLVIGNDIGFDYAKQANSGFAKSGTINAVTTDQGIGLQGNGSTGYYSASISVASQAMWLFTVFKAGTVSSAGAVVSALGSSAASNGAFATIRIGDSTSSAINLFFRGLDATGGISKLGLTPVSGQIYAVVGVVPSVTTSTCYLYVNGKKYNAAGSLDADNSFGSTFAYAAIGALRRGSVSSYSNHTVLASGYGLGNVTESFAQYLSENPWQIFEPSRSFYFLGGTSGSIGLTGSYISGSIESLISYSAKGVSGQENLLSSSTLLSNSVKGLLGVNVTLDSGSLIVNTSLPLSSNNITLSSGTLSVQGSGDVIAGLLGINSSALQSALLSTLSVQQSGNNSIILQGTSTFNFTSSVDGVYLTSGTGGISTSTFISTTGLVVINNQGTISVYDGSLIRGLTGTSFEALTSSVLPSFQKEIASQNITLDQQTLQSIVARVLTGISTTIQQGTTSLSFSKSIYGEVVVSGNGYLVFNTNDIIAQLSGNSLQTSFGIITVFGKLQKPFIKTILLDKSYTIVQVGSPTTIIKTNNANLYN